MIVSFCRMFGPKNKTKVPYAIFLADMNSMEENIDNLNRESREKMNIHQQF